jgi:hypothetical protein
MKIKVPYILNDKVMSSGRRFGNITNISGIAKESGVEHLIYDTNQVTRERPKDFKAFDLLTEADYKEMIINPPLNIGDEVLFQNSTYGNIGILAKGKITAVEFNICSASKLYWYHIDKCGHKDKYNIYLSKEDFINRTKPKKELKENQRYVFTEYCIQQNNLVPVDFESETEVQAKIIDGYNRGESMRKSLLYTSAEKFYKKMFSQI